MLESLVFRHTKAIPFTYADLLREQGVVCEGILRGEPGKILFAEVAPVITMGKNASREDLFYSDEFYVDSGVEILHIGRGGKSTYHGPGQWVVFVVENLERLTGDSKGVRKAVDLLLNAAEEVCQSYLAVEVKSVCEVGIWKKGQSEKLVALGIQIRDRILQHGLCFNGFETETSFLGVSPCGLKDARAAWLDPTTPEMSPSSDVWNSEVWNSEVLKKENLEEPSDLAIVRREAHFLSLQKKILAALNSHIARRS